MGNDLPDYQLSVDVGTLEASSLVNGADAAKSASPSVGDVYLATDTKKLYICVAAGAWTGFDASILVQGILTLYADLAGGSFELENIADPTAAQSAATRAYVLAQVGSYLALAGGTMSGAIAMGTNKITGMGDPGAAQDAATKAYADTKLANVVEDTTPQLGGNLDTQSNQVQNLPAPSAANDAARKAYVDTVDDKLDDVTQAQPARAINTNYQNGAKIRVVTIVAALAASDAADIAVGAASPATTVVARATADGGNIDIIDQSLTAVILPNYYYQLSVSVGVTITKWTEWDLH